MIKPGSQILDGRYVLARPLAGDTNTWLALDEDELPYVLRLWPFTTNTPDEFQRTLWDSELRVLYRLSSTPGAAHCLLTLHDAAIDRVNMAFVMVLRADSSMDQLSSSLAASPRPSWLLQLRGAPAGRRTVWRAIQRLVQAVQLLHSQHILHRNIDPSVVYYDKDDPAKTIRLGGFEWSVRLGAWRNTAKTNDWCTPPEVASGASAFTFDSDWYALGTTALRCFSRVEHLSNLVPPRRIERALEDLQKNRVLTNLEFDLLQRLTTPDVRDRLTMPEEIRTYTETVLQHLDRGETKSSRTLVLVIDPKSSHLLERLRQNGYVPEPAKPDVPYAYTNVVHIESLLRFMEKSIGPAPQVSTRTSNRRGLFTYYLIGELITLQIGPNRNYASETESWDAAFCRAVSGLTGTDNVSAIVGAHVVVVTTSAYARGGPKKTTSWSSFLPSVDALSSPPDDDARKFLEYARFTNLYELVIRASEVLPYTVVSGPTPIGPDIMLLVAEREGPTWIPTYLHMDGGMAGHLEREIASGKPWSDHVFLLPEEDGRFGHPHMPRGSAWQVMEIRPDRTIQLRHLAVDYTPPSDIGFLRTYGVHGQLALFARRKSAVDRLQNHAYLIRSLTAPGMVYIDTGEHPLTQRLIDADLDSSKIRAIEKILRARPIFALQGPPGTGKTTLVAHLLREILEHDPVAQILVTAQSHGAVDVLRRKVNDEAFIGLEPSRLPLTVRLGSRETDSDASAETVAESILIEARTELRALGSLAPIQQEWLSTIASYLAPDRRASSLDLDFLELVKRAANISYCTTSSGDLEVLAAGTQTFDWAIVEEAGQCHGFDLALPLQSGHRWLLIGDQAQLPPYRLEAYIQALRDPDQTMSAISALRRESPELVDSTWLDIWDNKEPRERANFKADVESWLLTFGRTFVNCESVQVTRTDGSSDSAASGCLTGQFRMHPAIGNLVAEIFYDQTIVHMTEGADGLPNESVRHLASAPLFLRQFPIVWVNTPWAAEQMEYHEVSEPTRYKNPAEARIIARLLEELTVTEAENPTSVAVLTPYAQQVHAISVALSSVTLASGLSWREQSRAARGPAATRRSGVYTVDSFQGDEAKIVVLSLVRNNNAPLGSGRKAFGFLTDPSRLNVMLSRAEQLLVIVGSWEFFSRHVAHLDESKQPTDDLQYWKKLVSLLSSYFDDGTAALVDAAELDRD